MPAKKRNQFAPAKNRHRGAPPIVLSIAGHDPSSGAGITADVKTIAAHGCYGVTCITGLTVQSTRGVRRMEATAGQLITEMLEELAADMDMAAVKIGMLASAEAARAVAGFLERHKPRYVVLDPVLKSSSGAQLLSADGVQILKDRLFGQALVITPNIDEAGVLAGMPVTNLEEMALAAERLRLLGARNVIVTGGHLNSPADLISAHGARTPVILRGEKIVSRATHGTGCAFSTALACNLARGQSLIEAAKAAKRFVAAAMGRAPRVGKGLGPVL